MKVLMIGPARSVNGGISAVVNNYFKAGLDKKIEIGYLPTMKDGSKVKKLAAAVMALLRFPLMAGKYDIVHIHMSSDSSLYRKLLFINLTKLFGKKMIIHQHGGDFQNFFYHSCSKRKQDFIRTSLRKADKFVVVAPHLKELFQTILEEKQVIYLPNAIEIPEEIRITEDKDDESYKGSQKVLFLGRLCKEKGIGELLEAVKELKEEFPGLQVVLGGVWEDYDLKQKADILSDFVYQPGWISGKEKEAYLKDASVFVLPTYFEGMPISLLEAMSYGMAVVASGVGSIPEIVEDGRDGLLIKPKDIKDLKEKLAMVLSSPALRKQLGSEARKTVEADFDIKNNVRELLRLYKELEK